mgnify:CR=1 FL=1
MSHPDPLFDPDNAVENDIMDNEEVYEMDGVECGREDGYEDDANYDDYNDFYDGVDADDRTCDYWAGDDDLDNSGEIDWRDDECYDDSMDGDHDSGMTSAGWGTDEDYGYYGEDY